jgi:hypothetical protein
MRGLAAGSAEIPWGFEENGKLKKMLLNKERYKMDRPCQQGSFSS